MKHKNGLGRRPWLDAVTYIALILASLISMFPVLWAITTALKTDGEVNSFPPTLLPGKLNLGNFSAVIFQSDFPKYLLNSVIVTVICILVATLIAAHAAYALTNFRIRYKKQMMFIILMTSMVPPVAMLVPLYMLSVKLGLYDTRFLLILIYTAWRVPVLAWILRGFFEKLPKELMEAGIIDGCSQAMVFYRIILPISKPGIVSAALLSAVYVWNDFLVSSTFTTKNELRMLSIGLYNYISQYGIQWDKLMAAVTISIVPIVILFVLLQRHFVEGMAAGAVKG
jgi:hypothetical protein